MEELLPAQEVLLHQALRALRQELSLFLREAAAEAAVVELDQAAVGRISRVDALQAQRMAQARRERTQLRLQQVAVALQAVDDGDYGWCKRCGEPIGFPRLQARPESPCCVPCMQALGR